jgi:asparagine synthase (glutamine-hydrolysing)
MCGIAGVVGGPPDMTTLRTLAHALAHRGPDGDSYYAEGGQDGGLAFTRLAIVDLRGGAQPMTNEDGRLHVVFNGEIYDHPLLRRELEQHGHRFATDHSDTEVLVHGFEEWGDGLFDRLNGMFAVAVWEPDARRLVLARDRYGIKPLYYTLLPDGRFAFASEIKAILRAGLAPAKPSLLGIREYFAFQNVWGEQTMFEGIYQLAAGSILTWHDGDVRRRRYWDITFPRSRRGSLRKLADAHREILGRAVRRQIAADVPVMSYLSGGIDSTAITVASHQVDPRVTAYSCIFDLNGVAADRMVDERDFSRLVAQTYDLDRVELLLEPDSLMESLRPYVAGLEDLRMGMGYPVYHVAGRVAQDARVVLSGTGGDEFHGGYVGRYESLGLIAEPPKRNIVRARLDALLRRNGNGIDGAAVDASYRRILNFLVPADQEEVVLNSDFLAATSSFDPNDVISSVLNDCPSTDWRDRVMYVDAKTYLAGLLVLEDKVSMAHSLETRVPLLDNEIVDFLLDVPFDTLAQGDTGKILFRESVRPWVPPEIYQKPKMGFGPPDASWYRGPLRPWIEGALRGNEAIAGVIRPEFVASVLDDHFSGRREATYQIWSLLNFAAWCDEFGFAF